MRTRAFIAFTVFAGLLAGCSLFLLVNTANAHEEPIIQLAQKEPRAWVISDLRNNAPLRRHFYASPAACPVLNLAKTIQRIRQLAIFGID